MISNHDIAPALLRRSFPLFLHFAHRELSGEPLIWNFHIDAMIYRLDKVRSGECLRQIFTLPPRALKSVIMTAWVAWMIGNDPRLKFICPSFSSSLAEKLAGDCLRIIQAPWYRRAFPALRLARRSVADFETTLGGFRLSVSIESGVTGRGAHYIVIDDPMNADDYLNQGVRERVVHWYDSSLKWRLESQDRGAIILAMQRLHEDDLAGFLLRRGGWHELRFPAIAPHDELVEIGHNLFYQRRQGHALQPARQSLARLHELRAENAYLFETEQNQNPLPLAGHWVDPAWFKTFQEPPSTGVVIASVDTAAKTSVKNDYSVIIIARYYQKRFYILDVHRERMEFGALRAKVVALCRSYRVDRLLIEDASTGEALIQMLRSGHPGVPMPIACRPDASKEVRFQAQASRIEAGEVVLPETAPWLPEFIREIAAFPGGRFKDQADALTQLLKHGMPFDQPLPNVGPMLYDDGQWSGGDTIDWVGPDFDPWA